MTRPSAEQIEVAVARLKGCRYDCQDWPDDILTDMAQMCLTAALALPPSPAQISAAKAEAFEEAAEKARGIEGWLWHARTEISDTLTQMAVAERASATASPEGGDPNRTETDNIALELGNRDNIAQPGASPEVPGYITRMSLLENGILPQGKADLRRSGSHPWPPTQPADQAQADAREVLTADDIEYFCEARVRFFWNGALGMENMTEDTQDDIRTNMHDYLTRAISHPDLFAALRDPTPEAKDAEVARLRAANKVQADLLVEAENARSAAEAALATVRKSIKDYLEGNYDSPRSYRPGKCEHGQSYWEPCEACIDKHFTAALAATEPTGNGEARDG